VYRVDLRPLLQDVENHLAQHSRLAAPRIFICRDRRQWPSRERPATPLCGSALQAHRRDDSRHRRNSAPFAGRDPRRQAAAPIVPLPRVLPRDRLSLWRSRGSQVHGRMRPTPRAAFPWLSAASLCTSMHMQIADRVPLCDPRLPARFVGVSLFSRTVALCCHPCASSGLTARPPSCAASASSRRPRFSRQTPLWCHDLISPGSISKIRWHTSSNSEYLRSWYKEDLALRSSSRVSVSSLNSIRGEAPVSCWNHRAHSATIQSQLSGRSPGFFARHRKMNASIDAGTCRVIGMDAGNLVR